MRQERQIELMNRVLDAGEHLTGLYGDHSMVQDASAYTDVTRFELEQQRLFRNGAVFVGLSAQVAEPGSYLTATFDRIPLVIVRQADGELVAMVNACRHRAAPLVEQGSTGGGLNALSCPYHAWTYELDGRLRARPGAYGAFDDVTINCDLKTVAVAEKHGIIFVRPDSPEPIDVDQVLAGAEDDLAAFDLSSAVHIDTQVNTWNINWKMILDTFTEVYHIRTLHPQTIAPYFTSDGILFEPFGANMMAVGLRNTTEREREKDEGQRSIVPYGTIQYFLVPSGLITHQIDHFETWRIEPISVNETRTYTSAFALKAPVSAEEDKRCRYNLDLLVEVTGAEDFVTMEKIQRSLESGVIPHLVYGSNEAPLVHLHESINAMVHREG